MRRVKFEAAKSASPRSNRLVKGASKNPNWYIRKTYGLLAAGKRGEKKRWLKDL
jgi:hypothetical protein